MVYQPSKMNGTIAIIVMIFGFFFICALLFFWAMISFTSEEDCYSGGYTADDPVCQRLEQDKLQ